VRIEGGGIEKQIRHRLAREVAVRGQRLRQNQALLQKDI